MFKYALTLFLAIGPALPAGQPVTLASPAGHLVLTLHSTPRLAWSLKWRDRVLLTPSPLRLELAGGRRVGGAMAPVRVTRSACDRVLKPVVPVKSATVAERYNELLASFAGGFHIRIRAYDQGVALRFEVDGKGPARVSREQMSLCFSGNPTVWFPEEKSFVSHSERLYLQEPLRGIAADRFCSLPALVVPDRGPKLLITESDLTDYPGLYLRGTGGGALTSRHPAWVVEEGMKGDRNPVVRRRADHIARITLPRALPWRIVAVAERDADLLLNQLVYLLARPCQLADTSWIRPGKVAWDWYNATNLFGVDFKAGVNTATYRHYIDFAARHGIEYIILDEGWYVLGDLFKISEGVDLEAIFAHARRRGVGVIPWVVWKTLDRQLEPALKMFSRLGAAGLKIDFMQRDDQAMVRWYERIAAAAARHRLLVDFHGSYKPAGLRRTWPNVLTREGVKGLENNKWSAHITPEHNLTLPFIRMVAGPMDYTPGSMDNVQEKAFKARWLRPMAMGTRCHQLAMYVVYESPLQMLADSPSLYAREGECMRFLGPVPTVWDETRVLHARLADLVVLARRRGREWWVGAMTDWKPRRVEVDLGFLGVGRYRAQIWQDGVNAARCAIDYRHRVVEVGREDRIPVRMAPGGGWAARMVPIKGDG